jgi:hypothetical protein
MPVVVEAFPDQGSQRTHCLVWTRPSDGARIVFGCDTEENCATALPLYAARAQRAEDNGWDDL